MTAKMIVVTKKTPSDEQPSWWLAEANPYGDDPIRILEPFPDEFIGAWTKNFVDFLKETAPQLVWFEEKEGETEPAMMGAPLGDGREIVFPD